MGRHRRAKLALGARSTVVKAAAAMGVATALAAGINSAANGPVNPQAAADTTGDPVNLAGNSTPDHTQHTGGTTTGARQSVPTGFATESATAPKLIQPASDTHKNTPVSTVHAATSAVQTVPNATATEAPVPPATGTPGGAPSTAPSTPDQPPASQAPAPPQGGGDTGSGSGSGTTQTGGGTQNNHPVGSLLGGVVGTVGGVVDGLLG